MTNWNHIYFDISFLWTLTVNSPHFQDASGKFTTAPFSLGKRRKWIIPATPRHRCSQIHRRCRAAWPRKPTRRRLWQRRWNGQTVGKWVSTLELKAMIGYDWIHLDVDTCSYCKKWLHHFLQKSLDCPSAKLNWTTSIGFNKPVPILSSDSYAMYHCNYSIYIE